MTDKKLLIVDYDAASLESLAAIFEPYRFQIIRASDGQEAYDKFKEDKPDVVVLARTAGGWAGRAGPRG